MRLIKHSAMTAIAPAFFYLALHGTRDACIDQSTGSAILKVAVAVLVGGVFLYNHFRDRIKTLYSNLASRGEERERDED